MRQQMLSQRRSRGVPLGYRENWAYKGRWSEAPIRRLPNGKKLWKFRFRATKNRSARTYGSFGKGTIGRWKIVAIQDIKKTNKGQYQTDMKGYKVPIFFKVRRPRKSRFSSNNRKGRY